MVWAEQELSAAARPSVASTRHLPALPCPGAENAKIPCVGGHPTNIIMLCCDAFGVLPPVAKLTKEQVGVWPGGWPGWWGSVLGGRLPS